MMMRDLWMRLRAVLRRSEVEREMEEELQFHFEAKVEKLVGEGMRMAEARRRARLAIGGTEQIKEECRDARGVRLVETVWQDVRYGWRSLQKSPGFTVVAILALTLGIGVNTALFTIVHGVLLNPLPFPRPERLVSLWEKNVVDEEQFNVVSGGVFGDWQKQAKSLEQMALVGGPYEIVTRVYGRDGVMGALEPQRGSVGGHEVFILWDVISEFAGAVPLDRDQRLAPRRAQPDPEMARADLGRRLPVFAARDRPRPRLRVSPEPRARARQPDFPVPHRVRGAVIMATLGDLAKLVRSKNAGPFWLTIDIMFDDADAYRRARDAEIVNRAAIARLYNRNPADIIVVNHDTALAIKVSFPRPESSGSKHDSDVYGGQQYAPLLGLEVPG